MLKLKAKQMRALGASARLRFEEASIALLRKEFPSSTAAYSDDVLRQFREARD
jgi:hypothetical protein